MRDKEEYKYKKVPTVIFITKHNCGYCLSTTNFYELCEWIFRWIEHSLRLIVCNIRYTDKLHNFI